MAATAAEEEACRGTLGVADGGSPASEPARTLSHAPRHQKLLRKLGRHSEAVEGELRAADRAMQSSPAAERDLPSLALIPDIFATQAVALARQQQSGGGGGGGGGGTAQGDWRAMLTAAVSEARAVLALAPDDTFAGRGAGSFKRCDAQVLLARMLFTELGMTPQHEQKAEPDRVKAQAKETFELAAAALKGARHHNDQRVAMLAGSSCKLCSRARSRTRRSRRSSICGRTGYHVTGPGPCHLPAQLVRHGHAAIFILSLL